VREGQRDERPAPHTSSQYRPTLQPPCLHDRQQPLHEPAARLALATERLLPPQHRQPRHPLDVVVGRLHPLHTHERPQRRLHRQQLAAGRRRLAAAAGPALFQDGQDILAQARRVATENTARQRPIAHPVPPSEQHVRQEQQVLADRRAGVVPVHHRLEVPLEMGPADLPAVHGHLVIGRPAVAADDALDHLAQKGGQPRRRAAGVDDKGCHRGRGRRPQPAAVPGQLPARLIADSGWG
jgi:hypothetical protein